MSILALLIIIYIILIIKTLLCYLMPNMANINKLLTVSILLSNLINIQFINILWQYHKI